ncbi:T9SS type A sorting domain-containing protein [Rubrivirga sp. IMCC45206]|uniref:T9SS type A sorting domain-containing protein n=1 Tax=Rubrivirga sp. IMCC45206 TaxID=3391614 RepID=UPI0039902526
MARTLLLTLVLAATTTAQPAPLVWERGGEIEDLSWAGFDGDTLVAVRHIGTPLTLVLPPGATSFTPVFHPNLGAQGLTRIGGDTLAYRSLRNVFRTTDGGASWDRVVDGDAYSDPVVLASGVLLVGTPGNQGGPGTLGLRSTDRGATWAFVGLGGGADGIATSAFVEVPPSPAAPAGAIVAAGFNGVAYSTDDGRTWAPTALYGPLAYAADTAALVAGTDRVVAVVGANLGPLLVYASDDGGATWASLGPPPPGTSGISSRLLPAPDGALYLYETYGDDDGRDGRPVWRSVDGGATWADVGRVWTEWSAVPKSMAVGPDGRLWAAAGGRLSPGVPGRVGGVFRTVAPVWAVSEESAPARQALSVAVFPNPSVDRATVEVSHAARIVVVDALGREVAAWDGARRVEVDTSGWAPGAYVVRVVSASGARATAGLAVAR